MIKKERSIIRTRFAPSPTGFVHIGNLRTALYAYLIAKNEKGEFLLRIEDTDQKRKVDGSLEQILEALDWFGIEIDEGVKMKNGELVEIGSFGPYFQSKRLDIYKKYSSQLIEAKKAYPCFCSTERLDKLRLDQQKNQKPPMYDKKCLKINPKEAQKRILSGEKYVVRMNVPANQEIIFEDQVYGKMEIDSNTIDDQVIIKSDGFPTYHLAVVVDDYLMKITHIIRGEDWLPSTPKHILLYDFLGWNRPIFLHVPNVLNENRKKLSKRQGDVSVIDFKRKGYLPEALRNFLVLLGWNPKTEEEIFSLPELTRRFDPKGLHRSGAVFDYKKLDWMNAYYISKLKNEDLVGLVEPFLSEKIEKEFLIKILAIEKNRIKRLDQVREGLDFYLKTPTPNKELSRWKDFSDEQMIFYLQKMRDELSDFVFEDDLNGLEKIKNKMFEIAGSEKGQYLHPTRTALSGVKDSPGPFELAWVIGKSESLTRLDNLIKLFKQK